MQISKKAGFIFSVFSLVGMGYLLLVGFDLWISKKQEDLDRATFDQPGEKIKEFGSTKKLAITPIVNWYAKDDSFKTEVGVSYLVETDNHSLLFDVGFNMSPPLGESLVSQNLRTLGKSISDIDAIFVSHLHRDHVGGVSNERSSTISMLGNEADGFLGAVYAPTELTHPSAKVKVTDVAQELFPGVATLGVIPRQLAIGRIDEQALVINIEGKGLVVLVGCGHQTIDRLISKLDLKFSQPKFAIVGDIHYPVPEGRLFKFGIDVQRRLASGTGILSPLGLDDVDDLEVTLGQHFPKMMLGAHDTSDYVLNRLAETYPNRFSRAIVGERYVF